MFEGFAEIYPDKKVYGEYGVNILQDGVITINDRLRKKIGERNIRFYINEDGNQIIIEPLEENCGFRLNKAGRFKNSNVCEGLKKKKMIFPIHFTLVEKEGYFKGDLQQTYSKKLKEK